MKDSVIYQDIVQKEALKLIGRQLKQRFCELNTPLIKQVSNLSADEVEELGEALLDFSEVADLEVWLTQQN